MDKRKWLLLLMGVILTMGFLGLFGCDSHKGKVDPVPEYKLEGGEWYGAKDSYKAGELVVLEVVVCTDTSYTVKVDGEIVTHSRYDSATGCLYYSFPMPDHDAKVEVISKNLMAYEQPVE